MSLKNKNLQVIIKIANIELTKDDSEYEGSSWHVEGCKNENIIATGIYYFENKNISESKLEF